MYLWVMACEVIHVKYEISVVQILKFWEKRLRFPASSVVDQWVKDVQLGRKCILFNFVLNLNHNNITQKICTIFKFDLYFVAGFRNTANPLPFMILLLLLLLLLSHNYGMEEDEEEEEEEKEIDMGFQMRRVKEKFKKYGKDRTW